MTKSWRRRTADQVALAQAAAVPGPGPWDVPWSDTQDRVVLFDRILASIAPGRLLDLGAGHGLFSIAAHQRGWEVTAVDARDTRFPSVAGINWIRPSAYDVIAILGLLYHLDLPAQLDLLRRVSHTVTILDTHVATTADLTSSPHRANLGEMITQDGYLGRLYQETPGRNDAEREAIATASWGNPASFWADETEQLRMLRDCGFASVLRMSPPYTYGRTFYLCLPDRTCAI
jgi:hypothetical protein